MTNQTTNQFFLVLADLDQDAGSTPYSVLFGSERTVFATEAEAEAAADNFNSYACWGADGDQVAGEVGIRYYVEECGDFEEIERLGGDVDQARKIA